MPCLEEEEASTFSGHDQDKSLFSQVDMAPAALGSSATSLADLSAMTLPL